MLDAFFRFQILRGDLRGDPTLPIERAKSRAVHRTTFTPDDHAAIIASGPDLRDRIALRLLPAELSLLRDALADDLAGG